MAWIRLTYELPGPPEKRHVWVNLETAKTIEFVSFRSNMPPPYARVTLGDETRVETREASEMQQLRDYLLAHKLG